MALVFDFLGVWKQELQDTTDGATEVALCRNSDGDPLVVVDTNGDVYSSDSLKDGEAAERYFGRVS